MKYTFYPAVSRIALLFIFLLSSAVTGYTQSSGCSIDPKYSDPEEFPPVFIYEVRTYVGVVGGQEARDYCFGESFSIDQSFSFPPNGFVKLSGGVSENVIAAQAEAEQNGQLTAQQPGIADATMEITVWAMQSQIGTGYSYSGVTNHFLDKIRTSQAHPDTNARTASRDISCPLCCPGCNTPGGINDPINGNANTFGNRVQRTFPEIAHPAGLYAKLNTFNTRAFVNVPQSTGIYPGPSGAEAKQTTSVLLNAYIENHDNDGAPECKHGPTHIGNPMHIGSGNKFERAIDYEGVGKKSLNFIRSYNSTQSTRDIGMGNGWVHNFSNRIEFPRTDLFFTYRPDGRALLFQRGGGRLNGPPEFKGSLTLDFRSRYLLDQNNDIEELYGSSLNNLHGKLLFIRHKSGYHQILNYTNNQLTSVTDSHGRSISFTYDSNNRLKTFTDPDGKLYNYHYDNIGNLTSVDYPAEQNSITTIQYHYEDTSYPSALTGITDETGSRYATWAYANIPDQERIPFRDFKRVVLSEKAGAAEKFSIIGTGDQQILTENTSGRKTTYLFKREGNKYITDTVDGAASSTCPSTGNLYTYAQDNFKETVTDKNGYVTEYQYDSQGNVSQKREGLVWENNIHGGTLLTTPNTYVTTTTWDNNRPLIETVPGLRTTYTYYSNGKLQTRTETDTTNHTTPYPTNNRTRTWTYTYTYHTNGITVATEIEDGPRTDVQDITTRTYDINANLIEEKNALGHKKTYSNYDGNGRPGKITDENGTVTDLTYHPRGWIRTSTIQDSQPGSLTTEYQYYKNGLQKRIIFPDQSYIEFIYNAARHMTATIAGTKSGTTYTELERIDYTPDPQTGEWIRAETKDQNQNITRIQRRAFNELGFLKETLGNNFQKDSFGYDSRKLLKSLKEHGQGNTLETTRDYDERERLEKITDPINGKTSYSYDPEGNLSSITDSLGNTTSYIYDGFGYLIQESHPDSGTTSYRYDEAGNRIKKTDARGKDKIWMFDELNRTTKIIFPGNTAENTTLTYDTGNYQNLVGRLAQVTDESGETHYGYDSRGNVTETEVRLLNNNSYLTTYEYNKVNNLSKETTPTGHILHYLYDSLGRLSSIEEQKDSNSTQIPVISSIKYLPFGPSNELTYGNTLQRNLNFDTDYRISGIDILNGSTKMQSLSYHYDEYNNIQEIDNLIQEHRSEGFDYDELHRLINARGPYGRCHYSYDSVGNRQTRECKSHNHPAAELYNYPAPGSGNRLERIETESGPREFGYDQNGNLTADNFESGLSRTLQYNDNNRLSSLTRNGSTTTTVDYRYNYIGERVQKTVQGSPGKTRYYLYNRSGMLSAEIDSTGNIFRYYIYANGERTGILQNPGTTGYQTFYVGNDHLGTSKIIFAQNTHIAWEADHHPFGEMHLLKNTISNDFRFPGQYEDPETGYYYNYFRDYDPTTGRYIQSDPIGVAGGVNLYAYAEQNPLVYTDSSGLWFGLDDIITGPIDEIIILGGLIFASQIGNEEAKKILKTLIGSRTKDPDDEECKRLAQKIKNLKKDIEQRHIALEKNPNNLPFRIGPGEKLRETIRGHQTLLTIRIRILKNLEERYEEKCKNKKECE